MKLQEFKLALEKLETIAFQLPNGALVPGHFHVTEVGKISKHFIDCGGTERKEERVNFQLWNAQDYDHRLHPNKLLDIISLSEKTLGLQNAPIEVEYQGETIQKFGLEWDGKNFMLTTLQTDCLAKEQCGIPLEKPRVTLSQLNKPAGCSPNSNCC